MLLRALGEADAFTTFPSRLDLDRLQLYPPKTKSQVDRFEDALALLRERGEDVELQKVLKTMLASRGKPLLRARFQRGLDRIGNYAAHRKVGR